MMSGVGVRKRALNIRTRYIGRTKRRKTNKTALPLVVSSIQQSSHAECCRKLISISSCWIWSAFAYTILLVVIAGITGIFEITGDII